ncbi:unnamed protein product, partial [marine sediment metagenome]
YMIAAALIAFATTLWSPRAMSQQICYSRDDVMVHLDEKYSETVLFDGVTSDDELLEIYVANNGTFTIITWYPNKCMKSIVSGTGFDAAIPPEPKPKGDPS